MRSLGLILHPRRDCTEAVTAILHWAAGNAAEVLGIEGEIQDRSDRVLLVRATDIARRAELLVSLGGDGTMLRALRLADRQPAPVLGVNLGKLGFLAEVDVPGLPAALSAVDAHRFTAEPRVAIDATHGTKVLTAFNDVAVVRVPGRKRAAVGVYVDDRPFVSYAGDAVIVATTTGSTAYSFSAGGPIVSPTVEALLVTPAAPHSAYNRGVVTSLRDPLALRILPSSGRLAIEVDGRVAGYAAPGEQISIRARTDAAHVIRLGQTTFYERARRKLRLTDSPEIPDTAVCQR
jgi:NAD+ kinase